MEPEQTLETSTEIITVAASVLDVVRTVTSAVTAVCAFVIMVAVL